MNKQSTERQLHNGMIQTLIRFTSAQLDRKEVKLLDMKEDLESYEGFMSKIKDERSVVPSRVRVLREDIKIAEHIISECRKGVEYLKSQKIK